MSGEYNWGQIHSKIRRLFCFCFFLKRDGCFFLRLRDGCFITTDVETVRSFKSRASCVRHDPLGKVLNGPMLLVMNGHEQFAVSLLCRLCFPAIFISVPRQALVFYSVSNLLDDIGCETGRPYQTADRKPTSIPIIGQSSSPLRQGRQQIGPADKKRSRL
jgi:hypothetical protein